MKTRYELGKELCEIWESRSIPHEYINKHIDFTADDKTFAEMIDFVDYTTDLPQHLQELVDKQTKEYEQAIIDLDILD